MVERLSQLAAIVDELIEVQERLQSFVPDRLRPCLTQESITARGTLVIGPRGTGKTTFLLAQAMEKKLMYLSADSPLVSQVGLWDLGREVFKRDFSGLIIDEVHFAPDWSRDLKALYDAYPRKIIVASDSSSVILRKGVSDLSRRFIKIQIPFLSFRDFVFLKEGITLPVLNFQEPDQRSVQKVLNTGPILHWFKIYMNTGLRPFFLEGDYRERQLNIIEKTIFSDLPFLLPQINENILRLGNAVIGMLALSSVPTINVESTCRDWNVGKDTFYNLLAALEAISLIRIVDFKKTSKSKSKGAKILFSDSSHYAVLGGNPGNAREAYVAWELEQHFGEVYASKDEKKGDFTAGGLVFEVGGASKKVKEADLVLCDDLELPVGKKRPLWMMGLRE